MKILVMGIILLFNIVTVAQSPFFSVQVRMDSAKTGFTRYKIEMKICEPKEMTKRGDWFSHDTSAIDFASLKAADIACGKYAYNGEGLEVLSGDREFREFNAYEFSGQVFAWEKILVFKISNWLSRAWWPEMYIVLPVKYKSFVTRIDLTGIDFQSGKVIFLSDVNASYKESQLYITRSMKNEKGIEVNGFPLRELLENK